MANQRSKTNETTEYTEKFMWSSSVYSMVKLWSLSFNFEPGAQNPELFRLRVPCDQWLNFESVFLKVPFWYQKHGPKAEEAGFLSRIYNNYNWLSGSDPDCKVSKALSSLVGCVFIVSKAWWQLVSARAHNSKQSHQCFSRFAISMLDCQKCSTQRFKL